MASGGRIPSRRCSSLSWGTKARSPKQATVRRPADDGGSSRMGDEHCPNETPSVDDATGYSRDDATGYSKEEEELESMTGEEIP
jgi:hypothetical protein